MSGCLLPSDLERCCHACYPVIRQGCVMHTWSPSSHRVGEYEQERARALGVAAACLLYYLVVLHRCTALVYCTVVVHALPHRQLTLGRGGSNTLGGRHPNCCACWIAGGSGTGAGRVSGQAFWCLFWLQHMPLHVRCSACIGVRGTCMAPCRHTGQAGACGRPCMHVVTLLLGCSFKAAVAAVGSCEHHLPPPPGS